jgi:type I restriction enzyme S subunit
MTPTCQLGDIASVVMGQAPPGSDCNKDGRGEPFVKAGEFSADKPIVREWTTNPLKRAQDGDVLVCVVGATAGKVNLAIDCAIGRSVAAVRPLPQRLDTNYLHHFLRTKTMALRHRSQGLAQGVITREMLLSLNIPLPPLEEQRCIAAILDQCASLTASQELHLSTMRELEGALLRQMDDEMPGGSKAVELKDLVESGDKINYGVVQPGVQVDAGVPLIRVGDLAAGIVNRSAMKFIDPAIESLYSRSRIRGNEILISCVGSIGVIAEARPEDVGSNIARAVARVPVSKDVNRTWLAAYLRSQRVQRYFTNELRTVSQPTLNIKQIQETEIILPPLEQQQAFANRLEIVHGKCAQRVYSLQTVKQLANTLATQVFTGGA